MSGTWIVGWEIVRRLHFTVLISKLRVGGVFTKPSKFDLADLNASIK